MLTTFIATVLALATQAHADLTPLASMPAPGAYVNEDGGPLLPLLTNAKSKIDIEIYTMNDKTVRQLLRDALSRGVKIRIVKDGNPLGSKCDVFGTTQVVLDSTDTAAADCADQQQLVADVRAAGGTFIPYDKRALCPNGGGEKGNGCFEHGKIALVDGVALLSTGNFDNTNLCIQSEKPRSCDRDYTLIINDRTVVSTLQSIFDADVEGRRYDVGTKIPASLKDTLTVSPISQAPIVAFIDSARESLEIETQYLKDPTMNAAITRAAQRGVKVNVTVASACAFGRPNPSESKEVEDVYSAFDAAGISSRMFSSASKVNGHSGYIHAKLIVVDGTRAWVGSENGSTESLTQNREYGLVIDSPSDVRLLLNQAVADHESVGAETWQESLSCTKDRSGGPADVPGKPAPARKKKSEA